MKRVVLLDYGSGNLRSAERALLRAGVDVSVTSDLDAAENADGLVVPGVGAFAACMAGVDGLQAGPVIAKRVADDRPVLGICVGMQILFDRGDEHGVQTAGLGLLPGAVTELAAPVLPHMGWNTVEPAPATRLVDGGERYYFVHSYGVRDTDIPDAAVSTSEHGDRFVAVVERGALAATQFHPEKSGDAGADLLRRWVASLP